MFPLFAPKFRRFKIDLDDDSTTTLQLWLLVATTFIFTFSLNGENPQTMTSFESEQVIVALHTAKLGAFVEQMLHRRISPSSVMGKFKGRCLHK